MTSILDFTINYRSINTKNACFGTQVTQNKKNWAISSHNKKKLNLHFDSHFDSCLYDG